MLIKEFPQLLFSWRLSGCRSPILEVLSKIPQNRQSQTSIS